MRDYHRLLERQVRKLLPLEWADNAQLSSFLEAVNQSYIHFEDNRLLVERAMRLSSDELFEKNQKLQEESERQQSLLNALRKAINEVSTDPTTIDEVDLLHVAALLNDAIARRKQLEKDLVCARENAETALQTRLMFLTNVSHEIRTPINAISGMAAILDESDLSESQREYLKAIRSSAEGLMVIVSDILDVSKLESGKFSIEEIPFDLDKVIAPLIQSLSLRGEEKGLTIHLRRDPIVPQWLAGDPTRIRQVLLNLLTNAIKFTDKGDITLRVLQSGTKEDALMITFEVEDSGVGIEKDKLDFIFEQFAQEDITVTRKYGGTGLGLSISKSLVEMMGGELKVKSEKGKGSTFGFTLRLRPTVSRPTKGTPLFGAANLNGLEVLVVEDNELNRFLAITILKKWNARVQVAANGKEALQLLKKGKIDLVLLDIQMPVMDGLETIRRMRQELYLRIPVIGLSANAAQSERDYCLREGMDDYLSKPYRPEDLFECISRLCAGHLSLGPAEYGEGQSLYALDRLSDMYGGNHQHIQQTVKMFIDQMEGDRSRLISGLESRDFEAIRNIVHRMMPNLELFQVVGLYDDLELIRLHAGSRNLDFLSQKIPLVNEFLKKVNLQLSQNALNQPKR